MSADPSADRNLLFGVLAFQADLITQPQFAEVHADWINRQHTPFAELLAARRWLTDRDRAGVDWLVERTLAKHGGDVRACLADVNPDLWAAQGTVAPGENESGNPTPLARVSPITSVPLPTEDGDPGSGHLRASGGRKSSRPPCIERPCSRPAEQGAYAARDGAAGSLGGFSEILGYLQAIGDNRSRHPSVAARRVCE